MNEKEKAFEEYKNLLKEIDDLNREVKRIKKRSFYTRRGKPIYSSNASANSEIDRLNEINVIMKNKQLKLNRIKQKFPGIDRL